MAKPMQKGTMKSGKKSSITKKSITVKEVYNKSQVIRHLTEVTCLPKKDVVSVMESLQDLIEGHLKKRGPGEFVLLGLAKFKVVHKPATKARKGVNPFTGEPATFAAKPARNVVKIRPLKKLKDIVAS